ncbi:MAG: arabinofuranosidase catalytic domain-containing protein, partial [Gemmatimonadales bacterium]
LERREVSANIPRQIRDSKSSNAHPYQQWCLGYGKAGMHMTFRSPLRSVRQALLLLAGALTLAVGVLVAAGAPPAAAASLPCDIYASASTPCVAAHSTTRALYASYDGALYQVRRASDGATANISPLSAGGVSNAAAQDSFCAGTTCVITEIYDQSGHGNNLTQAPAGGAAGGPDALADATAAPIHLGGHKVYGVYIYSAAGMGYRDDSTSGIATGDGAEGEYAVLDGTHVNSGCCFDYGNAETNNDDNGNGHMDAVYFGKLCWFTPCTGSGPWVQADLENGLFAGANGSDPGNRGNSSPFVTAIMNNNGTATYAIKDANAQSGGVTTEYSGPLPDIGGYTPMHQEGAVILGTGGDNSNGSDGSFFEGVMTAGYPSAATGNAVQANVVAAGYKQVSSGFPAVGTAYTITNVNSGTVLDSVDCGIFDGTLTDLWSPLGNVCQEWDVTAVGSHYTISNVGNGMVLDAVDCETANGTVVRQWAQLDNLCQQWDITG